MVINQEWNLHYLHFGKCDIKVDIIYHNLTPGIQQHTKPKRMSPDRINELQTLMLILNYKSTLKTSGFFELITHFFRKELWILLNFEL